MKKCQKDKKVDDITREIYRQKWKSQLSCFYYYPNRYFNIRQFELNKAFDLIITVIIQLDREEMQIGKNGKS